MKDNLIYRGLSFFWRSTFLRWYRQILEKREKKYWEEHSVKYGKENLDKTFYVIRRSDLYCGLFSLLITNLAQINEAIKKGYIPVIDMQNDFNIYLEKEQIGRENSWEYFFKQPAGYSLQDISKSKNVIIGAGTVPKMFPYLDVNFLLGKTGELEYWRELAQKYIVLSDKAQEIIDSEYKRLFGRGDKILGVKCRGTDYTKDKPKNHPVQPSSSQILEKAKEIVRERNCTKVFLATEDVEYYRVFSEYFGDRLIVNKTDYMNYRGGSTGKEEYEQGKGGLNAGMEYLTTTVLLSRCDCLCAGCVSATVGALLLTKGYEYTYLFDLGIYE